jgi:hypothetical protein
MQIKKLNKKKDPKGARAGLKSKKMSLPRI